MGLPDSRDVTFTPNSVPEIPAATLNALQDTAVLLFEQTARTPPRCAIRSYDGSKIRVEYVRSAWVIDSITSKWACVFQDEPGVDVTVAALAPAAMSFAANTWYYLYLRSASGLPTYVISTTAPGAGRIYKSTDKTYRLIKSFRTNGAGAIIPFSMVDGDSLYTGGNFLELNFDLTVNSTSWTPVGTDYIPPKVRAGTIRAYLGNTATATTETLQLLPRDVVATIVAPGSSGQQLFVPKAPSGALAAEVEARFKVEFSDNAKQLSAKMAVGSGASSAYFAAESFQEWS
ncbi:hypothetical protein [uncultured Zoogloea sp.]|uniref:hypothetical protein n=1 Tax=uncultured Zoogloea sp. TaxID=160237 RepID=UPI00262760C8|nr:hypothetical protein [uncultured Zoogloea sp.]